MKAGMRKQSLKVLGAGVVTVLTYELVTRYAGHLWDKVKGSSLAAKADVKMINHLVAAKKVEVKFKGTPDEFREAYTRDE